jgi:hypothetical protein
MAARRRAGQGSGDGAHLRWIGQRTRLVMAAAAEAEPV